MPSGWHTQDPASADGIPLKKGAKALLKAYYRSGHLPSPMGGFLEPLRVRSESDGSGTILLECSASSLRYQLAVPKATRAEKTAVKEAQAEGGALDCPRCESPTHRLRRVEGHLVGPCCGVRFGRAL